MTEKVCSVAAADAADFQNAMIFLRFGHPSLAFGLRMIFSENLTPNQVWGGVFQIML
jgi:hypothetical protein